MRKPTPGLLKRRDFIICYLKSELPQKDLSGGLNYKSRKWSDLLDSLYLQKGGTCPTDCMRNLEGKVTYNEILLKQMVGQNIDESSRCYCIYVGQIYLSIDSIPSDRLRVRAKLPLTRPFSSRCYYIS